VLFALIFVQIAISAHAVLQPDHNNHNIVTVALNADHGHDHDGEDPKKHKCLECLLAKSFQTALAVDGLFDVGIFSLARAYIFTETDAVQNGLYAHYKSRAPPTFLI